VICPIVIDCSRYQIDNNGPSPEAICHKEWYLSYSGRLVRMQLQRKTEEGVIVEEEVVVSLSGNIIIVAGIPEKL